MPPKTLAASIIERLNTKNCQKCSLCAFRANAPTEIFILASSNPDFRFSHAKIGLDPLHCKTKHFFRTILLTNTTYKKVKYLKVDDFGDNCV